MILMVVGNFGIFFIFKGVGFIWRGEMKQAFRQFGFVRERLVLFH